MGLSSFLLSGQNLVPNHDFSQTNNLSEILPDGSFNDAGLTHWFSSPPQPGTQYAEGYALIHFGKKSSNGSIGWQGMHPSRSLYHKKPYFCGDSAYLGYPEVVEGLGYIFLDVLDSIKLKGRFYFYQNNNCSPPVGSVYTDRVYATWKDFIEVELKSRLTQGIDYTVEIHIQPYLRRPGPMYAEELVHNVGALVSADTFYSQDFLTQHLMPQVESSAPVIPKKWTKVLNSFVAKGDEKFLTLGNFRKAFQTQITTLPCDTQCDDWPAAYYFFDAIYLYKSTDTLFSISLPNDTILCPNATLQLNPLDNGGFKLQDTSVAYQWSDGSRDSTLTVSRPGTYWVTKTYNRRWHSTDTIKVRYREPYYSYLPFDTTVCTGRSVGFTVPLDTLHQLRWSDGGRTDYFLADTAGTYWLEVTSDCGTFADTVKVSYQDCDTTDPDGPRVWVPNAFSPNDDGLNETWKIANLPKQNHVTVFNRWGALIFDRENYHNADAWNGTNLEGQPVAEGIYTYKISYTYYPGIQKVLHGWVFVR